MKGLHSKTMNTNNRTINSIRNAVFGIGNQVVNLFLNFISRYVFIRILGIEFLGVNSLFTSILSILSLADLGLSTAISYSFYKPLAEKNYKKVSQLLDFYKVIYRGIAITVLVCGLILLPFLQFIVKTEISMSSIRVYYLFFLANTVCSYLFVYKTTLLSADQRSYVSSIISSFVSAMKILLQILAVSIWKSYIAYLVVLVTCTILNNLICVWQVSKIYSFSEYKNNKLSKNEKSGIIKSVKAVFLYKLSGILINSTDNILISTLVNTVAVGYYTNYNMIVTTLQNFIGTFFGAFTASIGNLINNDGKEKSYSVFRTLQLCSFWLSGIICLDYYLLINDFIKIWIGEQFVCESDLLIAIALNFYLSIILQPLWSYREATGLFMKIQKIMFTCAIVNLILSVCLGIFYGTAGIIIASSIARITTYYWYEPKLLFNEHFKQPVKPYFIDQLLNAAFVLILGFVMQYFMSKFLVTSWMTWIIKAILTTAILFFAYGVKDYKKEELKIIVSIVKRKILRK